MTQPWTILLGCAIDGSSSSLATGLRATARERPPTAVLPPDSRARRGRHGRRRRARRGAERRRRRAPRARRPKCRSPVVRYRPALARPEVLARPAGALTAGVLDVTVVSAADGRPLAGATVLAFTDYAARMGSYGRHPARTARSAWRSAPRRWSSGVYVLGAVGPLEPAAPAGRSRPAAATGGPPLRPPRARRARVPRTARPGSRPGQGVRVGAGRHRRGARPPGPRRGRRPQLRDRRGPGRLRPERARARHARRRASSAGGGGRRPGGAASRRAPSCTATGPSARADGEATNFAIAKALDAAVQDGCDVVNLSLGGGGADPVVRAAVEEAQESGLIVVAAAGNDGRAPVAFPADLPDVVAVSALGPHGDVSPDRGRSGRAPGSLRARRRGLRGRVLQRRRHRRHRSRRRHRVDRARRLPGPGRHLHGLPVRRPGILARTLSGSRRLRALPRSPERAAAAAGPSCIAGPGR